MPVETDRDEPRVQAWERRADLPLTTAGVVYLAVYAVQVLAFRVTDPGWRVLDDVLWVIWAGFAIDFVGRVVLARRKWRFVLHHPFDLLVIVAPFFRFLRLLRLVGVVTSLARVLRDDFRGRVAAYLTVSTSLVGFVAALAAYEAERDAPDATITSFGEAAWWVLTTITTVGYGDRYPVTTEGRLVAAGLMLGGIAILGTVTAAIATWFLEQIGARDASDALHPGEPSDTELLLVELRAVRARLDALEGISGAGNASLPALDARRATPSD
ncbi:potassium channel family protein [Actinomycetospora corticicola]|uniref:Voltage-gated potassium channel n=1 Tax=Actinomycetospora corticicola TaxID=663602 RepID=A0A7Y9DZ75_9PSEU|nr:potassium channel family protein [Actinomycetospora corticicola]NYD38100.1 voltage-gated potassium channel [Actinomycetospora corticicola]